MTMGYWGRKCQWSLKHWSMICYKDGDMGDQGRFSKYRQTLDPYLGFSPWVGKILWRRAPNSFQYSCLERPMDRGAWWASVHRVTKGRI